MAAAAAVAVLAVVVILVFFGDAVRVVIGLSVLILPGFAVAAALIPPGSLDPSRRVTIGLVSGVALTVIGGMFLNVLPPGLTAASWVVMNLIATIVALVVANARGHIVPANSVASARVAAGRLTGLIEHPSEVRATVRIPSLAALCIGLAVVLAVTSLSIARSGAIQADQAQAFTEFWVTSSPTQPGQIELGIRSHETEPVEYTVKVDAGGRPVTTIDNITLAPGEEWTGTVTIPTPTPTSPVHAVLTKSGDTTPYRELTLNGQASP